MGNLVRMGRTMAKENVRAKYNNNNNHQRRRRKPCLADHSCTRQLSKKKAEIKPEQTRQREELEQSDFARGRSRTTPITTTTTQQQAASSEAEFRLC